MTEDEWNTAEERMLRSIFFSLECEKCGGNVHCSVFFCRKCGYPNKFASPAVFEMDFGYPVQKFVEKSCKNGHADEKLDYEEDPEDFEDCRYCIVCGKKYDFIKE